jgi:hypothetical protein
MKIDEVITIDELPPPTSQIVHQVKSLTVTSVPNFTDTYWGTYGTTQLIVAIKQKNELIAYTIGVLSANNKSSGISTFMVPKNLYSWANDHGASALKVIKALISLSSYPVLSDIELSPAAKRFLQKKVETGDLDGRVFNLASGAVTPYDPDIWITDDDERILFLEHLGRNHLLPSLLMPTGTWNWRQLDESNSRNLVRSAVRDALNTR